MAAGTVWANIFSLYFCQNQTWHCEDTCFLNALIWLTYPLKPDFTHIYISLIERWQETGATRLSQLWIEFARNTWWATSPPLLYVHENSMIFLFLNDILWHSVSHLFWRNKDALPFWLLQAKEQGTVLSSLHTHLWKTPINELFLPKSWHSNPFHADPIEVCKVKEHSWCHWVSIVLGRFAGRNCNIHNEKNYSGKLSWGNNCKWKINLFSFENTE